MKKVTFLCTLTAIAAFGAGYITNQKVMDSKASNEWPYCDTYEETIEYYKDSKKFCGELLEVQDSALLKANEVMENNDLFDTDGSDQMAEYMELSCKADSLWKTTL